MISTPTPGDPSFTYNPYPAVTKDPMTDAERIKQLEWELDQEKNKVVLLRAQLARLVTSLERKHTLVDTTFDIAPAYLGGARPDQALFLGQAQAYNDIICGLKSVIDAK